MADEGDVTGPHVAEIGVTGAEGGMTWFEGGVIVAEAHQCLRMAQQG